MFTHARSATASGQGTEVNSRGLNLDSTVTPGVYPILDTEIGLDSYPLLLQAALCVDAKDNGAPAMHLQTVDAATGQTTDLAPVPSYNAGDSQELNIIVRARLRLQLVVTAAMTNGTGALFVQISGLGRLGQPIANA